MFNYSFFKILKISFVLVFLVSFLFTSSLFAQERPEVPEVPLIGKANIQTIVVRIIQIVLSLLGIIALGLIIWAGFLWMTAAGVEEKISKAKKILIGAIIGLVIVFSSWAITFFLIRALTEATSPSSSRPPGPPPELPEREFFITSVIPKENAIGVFRNSQVIANFNKYLKEESINPNSVIIKKTLTGEVVKGSLSVKNNSLKFIPETSCLEKESCYCFEANTQYTVNIKSGGKGVLSYKDDQLFQDKIWSFTTSDLLDLEKPVVYDYYPTSPPDVPRNSQIQVVFSKEIDPLSINKDTVKVKQADKEIDGEFNLGEDGFSFTPATFCPSPNENLKCFDKNVDISVSLSGTIQDYTGCNSLDCTNGKCQWTFHTSEEIDTEPPYILEGSLVPKRNEREVDRGTNIKATFSKAMNRVTINSATVTLQDQQANPIHPSKIELIDFKTFVFDPKEILEKEMIYGVTVSGGKTGVKSASGISMGKDFSWGFKTSKEAFEGKPYIDSIDPVSGPEGTCLTVKGANLKTSGELLFRKADGTFIRASEIGVWQDKYISGVVPTGLGYTSPSNAVFSVIGGRTKVKVVVEGKESNEVVFTWTGSELGACLLKLEPESGKWGSEIFLKGKRFGQAKEANDGAIFHQTSVQDFLSWQDKEIKVKVPEPASDGLVKVVKKGKNSNGIYFDVKNSPENKCTENNQCQPPNSNCCQNNICKENCPPVICLENIDCLTDCCINNFCQDFLACKGGIGDSCDGNKESIGCQLNNNLCLSSLICRESDCTCQKPEGKIHRECSGDKCIVAEGPGEDKCATDLNCGEGAEHRECLKDKCVVVIGPGPDQCAADKNCGPNALYSECSENQCKEIKGQGLDQCKEDKDCQGPIIIEGCEKETWTYQNSKYNFLIQYCKKDFPEVKKGLDIIKVSDKEIFFQGQEKNDAIGLRIEESQNFYSPLWWYKWKFPKSQALLQEMEIDGYSAVKEGNTIYIGATNIESNKIVPYIFIISKNDKASQAVGKIFDQMLENWRFNTNL